MGNQCLGDIHCYTKYILVMKGEAAHYCKLVAVDSAASQVVVEAVLDW